MRAEPASGAPLSAPPAPRQPVADLDVVVVTYRSGDAVAATLAAVPAAAGALDVTVTVVDNHSGDGTLDAVHRRFPGVATVQSGWNSGFARASNRGMDRGTGRYVLLLNPDAVPAPGALEALVDFADQHPRAGVVAPRLLNADRSDQLTARSFPTPAAAVWGRRSPLTRIAPRNRWSTAYLAGRDHDTPNPYRVDWVSGAAMLVPRRVVREVGALDERFFLFWEDADWCRRIVDAGHEVWCVPAAEVVHDEGGSRDHGWSAETIRWFHQGAYRYWVKHHAPSAADPARWIAAAALTLRAVVLTVVHGQHRRPVGAPSPRSDSPR